MNEGAAATLAAVRENRRAGVYYLDKPGLLGIVLKNYFLTLVTLSIYRFWARTRLRRYFWSNIEIAGEPLEYTGTGRELFLGFLMALAIIAPLAIAYMVLVRVTLGDPAAALTLRIAYFLVLATLIQAAHFRARRYRLTRTAWRGIHAGQTGSTWRYIGLSFLYGLLTLVTLGVAYPWMDLALARYKIGNTWFGSERLSLENASAWKLLPRWLAVLAIVILPLVVMFGANSSSFALAAQAAGQAHPAPVKPPHPMLFILVFVPLLLGVPAFISYWVASLRYIASCTRLGRVRVNSDARFLSVLGIALAYFFGFCVVVLISGALLYLFLAGSIYASVASHGSPADKTLELWGKIYLIGGIGGLLIFIWLPLNQILAYCWLRAGVIRHLVSTLSLENAGALASVTQSALPRQRTGEGLADSFEIGAF